MKKFKSQKGYDALWGSFGLSHASWLNFPRVLLHEMPDAWQLKMAKLVKEYDEFWNFDNFDYGTKTQITDNNGKLIKTPDWLINYRHPDYETINALKVKK